MEKVCTRNYNSAVNYVNSLFDQYSKIEALRLDFSYKKEYASNMTTREAKEDMQHLLSNRRNNPGLFGDCIGYIWELDNGPDKGPHFHCLFLYDGSRIRNDAYWTSKLGHYWDNQITDGKGLHFNCNTKKASYKNSGIGMISHSDTDKRNKLINNVIPYLTKPIENIQGVMSENERAFGKGVPTKMKSKAGRPRDE